MFAKAGHIQVQQDHCLLIENDFFHESGTIVSVDLS